MTEIEGGEAKLAELPDWRKSKAFSELERVALEYTERVTYTGQKVDDELFARLKRHFDEGQILALGSALSVASGWQRFIEAFGIRPDSWVKGETL